MSGAPQRVRSDCHRGGQREAVGAGSDWAGGRQRAKSVLFEYVRNAPDGVPLSKVVSDVFGDVRAGSADYQLARRFFGRRDDLFLVENRGDLVYVEPRPAAFRVDSGLESRSKRNAKTQDGDGMAYDSIETGPTAGRGDDVDGLEATAGPTADRLDGLAGGGDDGRPTAERFPKDRVRRVLDKVVRLDGGQYDEGHDYRRGVFRELAQYRDDIEDKWIYFRRMHGSGSEYLVRPYLTRYNDATAATEKQRTFRAALRRASSRHSRAAVVSLTVDPDRFESHAEATEAIRDGVSRWVQRESYQLGGRPENLKILDYQRNGLPHYHVVLFGVEAVEGDDETATGEATISTGDVRDYWDETAGVGEQVDVRPAYYNADAGGGHDGLAGGDGGRPAVEGDDGAWVLHDDAEGRVSLGYYLGKRIRELVQLAETDTADLFEAVESGDISLWRHALFWASGKRYMSVSQSLRPSRGDDGDGLPAVTLWRYVGVCRFREIPAHVRDNAVVCRSGPPPD